MMPTKGVIRKCIVCGKVLEPYNRTKFCSENCKKARKKEYNARWRAHTLTDNQKAWNTYGEFKNQPIAKPNEHPKTDGVFTDPWDCLVCRNAGDLCTLHEGMEAKGMKPAQYKHPEGIAA